MLVEIYCDKFRTGGKDGEVRPAIKFHKGLNAVIGDNNRYIDEATFRYLLIKGDAVGGTMRNKIRCSSSMKEILTENIALAIADDNSEEIEEINVLLAAKQKELVKLAHANKDYTSLADEIDRIREKKQRLLVEKAETAGYKKKIEELKDFINESANELTDYDESLVRKYIKEIRIFDDRFQVFFKAGVDVEIAR